MYFFLLVRNEKLVKEKLETEKQLETFQREVKHVSKANTAKEIRVLKKVVQNLEVGTERWHHHFPWIRILCVAYKTSLSFCFSAEWSYEGEKQIPEDNQQKKWGT